MSIDNAKILEELNILNIKGILIDIDNTLYAYAPMHENAIKACYKKICKVENLDIDLTEFRTMYRRARTLVTKSLSPNAFCRSRALAFECMFRDLNISQVYSKAYIYEDIYWSEFVKEIEPFDYIIKFLERCKRNDLIIAAVTDMQFNFQAKKLHALKLDRFIDFLVTSEEALFEKPHSAIFQLAINKMNLNKNDVIMIGDSYDKDIVGAKNAGIRSLHIQP